MGLHIKEYNYGYSTLHALRQLALQFDGIESNIIMYYKNPKPKTSFPNFIHHSDSAGIYISKSSKQYDKYIAKYNNDPLLVGDLDELKEEVDRLNYYIAKRVEDDPTLELTIYEPWKAFFYDIINARKIVEFK